MLRRVKRFCLLLPIVFGLSACVESTYDLSNRVSPEYPLKDGAYVAVDNNGNQVKEGKPTALARLEGVGGYLTEISNEKAGTAPDRNIIRFFSIPESPHLYVLQAWSSKANAYDYYFARVNGDGAEIAVYDTALPKDPSAYGYVQALLVTENGDNLVDKVVHGSRDTFYVLRELARNKLIASVPFLRFRRVQER